MSAWWDAQKILRAGLRAPLQQKRVTGLVLLVFVLPILVLALGMWILRLGFWDRNLGMEFFDPDGSGDPVLVQHVIWFLGSPEAPFLLMPVLFPLFVWAQAVWLNGHVTLRVRLGQWGRMVGVYALAAAAGAVMSALGFVILLFWYLVVPLALFIVFLFAPTMMKEGAEVRSPWRLNAVRPAVICWCVVDFCVVALLLSLPAGMLSTLAWSGLTSGGLFLVFHFLAAVLGCLSWVYTLFILTGMIAALNRKGADAQAALFR